MALTPKQERFVADLPRGFYCYALVDGDEVFYVGKGKRLRVFAHEVEARKAGVSRKCERIRSIWARGETVSYRLLGAYASEAEAYKAEREWIAKFNGLVNIACGGGGERIHPKERMRRHAENLLQRMVPFDQWIRQVPSFWADAIIRVDGSLETFYARWRGYLEGAATEPQPNVVTATPTGCVLGWE